MGHHDEGERDNPTINFPHAINSCTKPMSTDATDTKVVQTEVPREEYERLRKLAEQKGISLKEVLREAARAYGDRHLAYDATDPLFTVTPGDGHAETDARDVDERLARTYGEDLESDE